MNKNELLQELSGQRYNTLSELVTAAARLLPRFAPEQKKYGVAVYPDERAVRFYINTGLVDRPQGGGGASGFFTSRHLLQILAIKCLQREYLPLPKIREMLEDLENTELADIIAGGKRDVFLTDGLIAAPSRRRSLLCSNSVAFTDFMHSQPELKPTLPEKKSVSGEEWVRVSITDGIELNIRSENLPKGTTRKDYVERLAAKLRIYLENEKKGGG